MDSISLVHILKAVILPPTILVIMLALATILVPRWYRLGTGLLVALLIIFYIFSAPFTALRLIGSVEANTQALSKEEIIALNEPGAIVVLGGGRHRNAIEYKGDTVSDHTLVRVRYAAKVKKWTNLPLVVSGGKQLRVDKPEALLMKRVLQEDFGVTVEHIETESRNTWENAIETRKILAELKIDHILLITQAWHMPRSVLAFESAGFTVTPAPTGFFRQNHMVFGIQSFLPSTRAMQGSYFALHEKLGFIWYSLLHYFKEKPNAKAGQIPAS